MNPIVPQDVQSLLGKGEKKYLQQYNQILNDYMQRIGFDLTAVQFTRLTEGRIYILRGLFMLKLLLPVTMEKL